MTCEVGSSRVSLVRAALFIQSPGVHLHHRVIQLAKLKSSIHLFRRRYNDSTRRRATFDMTHQDRWLQACNRQFTAFASESTDPSVGSDFTFAVIADPQFGMIGGRESWEEEIRICSTGIKKINELKPKFIVIAGDLIHHHPKLYENAEKIKEKQIIDFKRIFDHQVDQNIPIVCVSGNHDIGDCPSSESISDYKKEFGDDYFLFYVHGVRFAVCNTTLYFDNTGASKEYLEQQEWLDRIMSEYHGPTIVFGHHPWFLYDEDEQDELDGFSLFRGCKCWDNEFHIVQNERTPVLKLFEKGGVTKMFAGHWHQNKCTSTKSGMEMVITSALGAQLGDDKPGFRLVKVSPQTMRIRHEYIVTEA